MTALTPDQVSLLLSPPSLRPPSWVDPLETEVVLGPGSVQNSTMVSSFRVKGQVLPVTSEALCDLPPWTLWPHGLCHNTDPAVAQRAPAFRPLLWLSLPRASCNPFASWFTPFPHDP